jgi:hypothetical protein
MNLVVRALVVRGDGAKSVLAMTDIRRDGDLQGTTLGLILAKSKTLIAGCGVHCILGHRPS